MKKFVYVSCNRADVIERASLAYFVMQQGHTPINLALTLEQQGNDRILSRADELWVFGTVDKRMWAEIVLAKKLRKPLRFFIIEEGKIREISEQNVRYDEEVKEIIIEEKVKNKAIHQIRLD
jgi:hypothetical protein